MFSEYRFVEVSNSMTFRPPQIHSLFFPASDFEKISKFSKPNHFYVVSNRVEVKRIFRFYRNMDDDYCVGFNEYKSEWVCPEHTGETPKQTFSIGYFLCGRVSAIRSFSATNAHKKKKSSRKDWTSENKKIGRPCFFRIEKFS